MNLYLVTRWGNNESPDGPNDTNTMFLVRAPDRDVAISLVEPVLQRMPHDRVQAHTNVCVHIGTDAGESNEPRILLGPIVENCWADGYKVGWVRHYDDSEWLRFDEHT